MAYHPDCGWSKKAAIYWNELALWLKSENLEDKIDLWTVNASEKRSSTGRGQLNGMGKFRGYPTIRMYHGAKNVNDFREFEEANGLTFEDLQKFIVKKAPI